VRERVQQTVRFVVAREGDTRHAERTAAVLREPLMRLCARYVVEERSGKGRALDPVAHFHLSNGARVERGQPYAEVHIAGRPGDAGAIDEIRAAFRWTARHVAPRRLILGRIASR